MAALGDSPGSAVAAETLRRFARDLAATAPDDRPMRLGVAVSGGPDSVALLLLAGAAQRAGLIGAVAAATVDHGLRAESADEARFVADLCRARGLAHRILPVTVAPGNVQGEARRARYRALALWARERGLDAVATAHHADDQAETLLMRLNRGSGLSGLAGVRARTLMASDAGAPPLTVIRPLLGWRRAELAAITAAAGIAAVDDPSNHDADYDRVRIRRALAGADWLDPAALAAAARHLAQAEDALRLQVDAAMERLAWSGDPAAPECAMPTDLPRVVALAVVERILTRLGAGRVRGAAVARLLDRLAAGKNASLGGVLARVARCRSEAGAPVWLFGRAPPRAA